MARRVFISFKMEDKGLVDGLRLLASNPNFDLEFYDESVRVAIDSRDADYIKRRIREKIVRAGVVLCLVNTDTHTSKWVTWELSTAIRLGTPIVAMAAKGVSSATLPGPIRGKVELYIWDPLSLETYIDSAMIVPLG